jgi:hypothetical protein
MKGSIVRWSVEVQFGRPAHHERVRARLLLAPRPGIDLLDFRPDGAIDLVLTVTAEDITAAVTDAVATARLWTTTLGVGLPVLGVRTYPCGQPHRPGGVWGTTELATQLGVSRQRAAVIAKRRAFPRPLGRLAMGPVYSRLAVLVHLQATRPTRSPALDQLRADR